MKTILKSVVILGTLIGGTANAAFVGAYDVSNWTKQINGGVINTDVDAPNSVTFVSSDNGGGIKNQDFIITAATDGVVNFHWEYTSYDIDGSSYDPFGFLVNDIFTGISANNQYGTQSGNFIYSVFAGDTFGFRANSTDSAFGSAITSISNFNFVTPGVSQVPVPAAAWLILAPLMGVISRKRKQAA